jgi:glycine cleavage system H lipoate-binding protein
MEGLDIFATKGAEYLFCGGFLLVLALFWKLMNPAVPAVRRVVAAARELMPWFQLKDDWWFHQGHAWAAPAGANEVTVGLDDFAQKLLGRPAGLVLPQVGSRLTQGEPAWQVQVDGHAIPMVSPVDGEVVEVNQDVVGSPSLVNAEPYDRGWLMRVKLSNPAAAKKNLLTGGLARAWMDGIAERVRTMPAGELGILLPDGGFPVDGFARALSPDAWDRVAREFLLTA